MVIRRISFWLGLIFILLVYFGGGALALPVLQAIGESEYYDSVPEECRREYLHIAVLIHHFAGVPVHTFNAIINALLLLACVAISNLWEEPVALVATAHCRCDLGGMHAMGHRQEASHCDSCKFADSRKWNLHNPIHDSNPLHCTQFLTKFAAEVVALRNDYDCKGRKIIPIVSVFKQWFVLQWFSYFTASTADLLYLLGPILSNGTISDKVSATWYLSFVYHVLSFAIPYFCGALINKYHSDYYKKLQGAVENLGSLSAFAHVNKKPDYDFVPGIPILGLEIPLSNPGYTMGITINIITLMCSSST